MKHLFFLFPLPLLASLFLTACGGGGDNKNPPSPVATSSAPATSSAKSSSSSLASSIASSVSSTSVSSASVSSSQTSSATSSIAFTITSTSFASGDKIPLKYSCYGAEVSPNLQWSIDSPDVKGFVLIMEDFDAIALVGYPYVHWNVYKIPADTRQIAEGATLRAMPTGSIEGVNHDGLAKYSGPCPPEGTGTHHYFFALYALNNANISVNTNKPMIRSDFEKQYAASIIQKAEMSGSYFYK